MGTGEMGLLGDPRAPSRRDVDDDGRRCKRVFVSVYACLDVQ